jgi:UDP-2,3-diacylglucosamine hydrolase
VLYLLRGLRERGIPIDYVSGNHDFWMGDFFESQLGITVHRDSYELRYAGRKMLCLHGDGLSKRDRGYRLLKRILRNPVNIWLYRKLPADWAIPLAKRVSGRSRQYTARRDHDFASDYEQFAQARLRDGLDIVAIGHLHIPVYKSFDDGVYINTGDFIHHFSYARIDTEGAELLYIGEQEPS